MNDPDRWYKVPGDVKDYIEGQLQGVADFMNVVSKVANIWTGVSTAVVIPDADLTWTDQRNGIIRISLGVAGGWLAVTAARGEYKVEVTCTFSDGRILTFPEPEEALPILEIRRAGG